MVILIHCDFCGRDWERYLHEDMTGIHANRCPHCGSASIDPETWKEIVSCARQADEVNTMLYRDHEEKHNTLFTVSYEADHLFNKPYVKY